MVIPVKMTSCGERFKKTIFRKGNSEKRQCILSMLILATVLYIELCISVDTADVVSRMSATRKDIVWGINHA